MDAFDFAIIGQGLAGTTLAWQLRWRGCRVCVVDREAAVTSSRIAAGLMTPVTGQRFAQTWRLHEVWPAADAFYRRIESELGMRVFHPGPMIRLFNDVAERAAFELREGTILRGLVRRPIAVREEWFAAPHGGFEMPAAGRLDVPRYLDRSRDIFARDGGYRAADIDPSDIAVSPTEVRMPQVGITAGRVIFCQGFDAARNSWFPKIPFNAAKGEILTVRIPDLMEDRVINRGIWLAPEGNGMFRVGSTYDRDRLNCEPTPRGREEIIAKLRAFLRLPFEVIDHRAAVRPIMLDQKPAFGLHPEHPRLGYFNGLGSKGSLQAPFFAEEFAKTLLAK